MSQVAVLGGGFGGLAAALRLAKLGHDVTLVEPGELGGALAPFTADGFTWDGSATHTLLPAVVRDLFRKTGRPLERELDLEPFDCLREHRFTDGTSLVLATGQGAQVEAFEALATGLGRQWASYVASYADDWEVLRRGYLEEPWDRDHPSRELRARLESRETLERRLRRTFKDERARLVAQQPFTGDGHDARNVPAWAGITAYVEQRFGTWGVRGGMSVLRDALVRRLETRRVTVLAARATDVIVREGRAVGAATSAGHLDADVVVCAIDPRGLPALARHVARTMPAIPPAVTLLGLAGTVPDLPHELVIHGDPLLTVRTGGRAPAERQAWTVISRGSNSEDVVTTLARRGLDVRAHVVTRLDHGPRTLVERWGGSPLGLLWEGRGTVHARLGPTTPLAGVYACGANATPGSGLPYVGLSAAQVAQVIGPA